MKNVRSKAIIAAAITAFLGILAMIVLPWSSTCSTAPQGQTMCTTSNLALFAPIEAVAVLLLGVILITLFVKWGRNTAFLLIYGIVTLLFIVVSFGIGWPLGVSALLSLIAAISPPAENPLRN